MPSIKKLLQIIKTEKRLFWACSFKKRWNKVDDKHMDSPASVITNTGHLQHPFTYQIGKDENPGQYVELVKV